MNFGQQSVKFFINFGCHLIFSYKILVAAQQYLGKWLPGKSVAYIVSKYLNGLNGHFFPSLRYSELIYVLYLFGKR